MNAINTHLTGESVHEHNDAAPSRAMWQAVLERAFIDATYSGPQESEKFHQREAHNWISRCGKDFRHVCDLAGMDADFLSNAYNTGRIKREWLKSGQDKRPNCVPKGALGGMVLEAMTRPHMTVAEITDALAKAHGHEFNPDSIGDCLRNLRRAGKVVGTKGGQWAYWSKPEVAHKPRPLSNLEREILNAMDGEKGPGQIARDVSEVMGEKIHPQRVTVHLRGPLEGRVKMRMQGRDPVWSKA